MQLQRLPERQAPGARPPLLLVRVHARLHAGEPLPRRLAGLLGVQRLVVADLDADLAPVYECVCA